MPYPKFKVKFIGGGIFYFESKLEFEKSLSVRTNWQLVRIESGDEF